MRKACGALLLAGLLAAGGIWVVRRAIAERLQATREDVIRLESESRERLRWRPVLRGDTLPGDAWDDYRKALPLPEGRPCGWDLAGMVRERFEGADPRMIEASLLSETEALSAVDLATRRADANPPSALDGGQQNGLRRITFALLSRAALADARGEEEEAVEDLLRAAQVGVDASRSADSRNVGHQLLLRALAEFGWRVERGGLRGKAGRRALAALELLRRSWPDAGPRVAVSLCEAGRILSGIEPYQSSWRPVAPGWRDLWSPDLLICRAWSTHRAWMARYVAAEHASEEEYARVVSELSAELAWVPTIYRPDETPQVRLFYPGLEAARDCRRLLDFVVDVLNGGRPAKLTLTVTLWIPETRGGERLSFDVLTK